MINCWYILASYKDYLGAIMKGKIFGINKLSLLLSSFFILVYHPSSYAICSVPAGWYVEGNVGWSHLSDVNFPNSSFSKDGFAGNANLGYKFNPYFGMELGGTYYATSDIKFAGETIAHNHLYGFDLAGKGILPFSDTGFELFAKLGVSRVTSSVTIQSADRDLAAFAGVGSSKRSHVGLYTGLGGQYYLMPEIALVVQWQRAWGGGNVGVLDLYTAGLSFILN